MPVQSCQRSCEPPSRRNRLDRCAKFVAAEFEKDPNYEPPDEVAEFIFFAKDFLDKIRPVVEARLKEMNLSGPGAANEGPAGMVP
jgi:hypothetical protein